jgi:hypothetical protein
VHIHAKGDRVSQPTYGAGTVAAADSLHTVIDFDDHGLRTFVTNLVHLEKTSSPAPVRAKAVRRTKKAAAPAAEPGAAADQKPKPTKK